MSMYNKVRKRSFKVIKNILSVAFILSTVGCVSATKEDQSTRNPQQVITGDVGKDANVSGAAANRASMDYTCRLKGVTKTGTVDIDDQLVVGPASCMYFGKNVTLCFRFERQVKIDDIYLALRYPSQLNSPLNTDYISLENMKYGEGSVAINTVKTGPLQKAELACKFTNVNWK